jgi:hypothetical protein
MTMVERIAHILEPQAWVALGAGDTLAYKNRRTSSIRKAIAVLKVMVEPNDEMINEAWRLIRSNLRYEEVYSHMIDAAIKEAEE